MISLYSCQWKTRAYFGVMISLYSCQWKTRAYFGVMISLYSCQWKTRAYFGVMISLYSCRSMRVAAAMAPYGMTTLLISNSARLFCRLSASLSDDELADWVRRGGRPGFGLMSVTDRPRWRPLCPKRRLRRNGSATARTRLTHDRAHIKH